MSVKASFWAIEQRPRSRDHKLVLMLLADWADETGEAWPRQTTIAEKAMCSVRHVIDVVATLRLTATSPGSEQGGGTADRVQTGYKLNLSVSWEF
jgi:hypothetical protein